MSDLCMCELEDIAWDEFCQSEDHIVPHPGSNRVDYPSVLGESCQKPRLKGNTTSNCAGDQSAPRCAGQGKEQGEFSTCDPRNMFLKQDAWSPASKNGFPSPSDSNSLKEVSSLVSANSSLSGLKNNNTDSNGSEICENDTTLSDKIAVVDNNSFSYPLDDITQTSKEVDFSENTEEKDPSDILYYGWPEIGNFEDVDRMFRNCDSTFGVGCSKEDELSWLSLADDIGVPGDMSKSDLKFPSPESSAVEEISNNSYSSKRYFHDYSAMASSSVRFKESSMPTEKSDSYMPSVNGFAVTDSNDGFISKERGMGIKGKIQAENSADSHAKAGSGGTIKEHKKQLKLPLPIQLEGKRKKHYFGNGSFNYISDRSNPGSITHPLFPPTYNQHQHQNVGPHFYNYLQNTSFVHSDSSHLSDQIPVEPTPFSIKSEMGLTYPSAHASNRLQTLEGIHSSFHMSATEGGETKEKLHNLQVANLHLDSYKHISNFSGLGSSNVHESSTMSSDLDDISLEAAVLRQLQLVMEQFDLRTKLCIRDSLYRLARSAEQRHDHINQNGGCGDRRDSKGTTSMADGTKCAGFTGMETDTNPLDRSIAHLLFHRPSDTSAVPAFDSSPFKLPRMVHGSITSQTVMVNNLVVREETSAKTENQGFEC